MEMSNAENFLAGFCDVVNPIKKPSAVYAHPAEKLQNTLVFNLSIRDRLDRKPGCKTDGLVMGNPVAKLIDMVQLLECLFPVTSGEIQVIGFRISYAKIAQSVDKVPFLLVEFIRKWRFIRRELCLPDKAYSDGHKKDGPKTVLNSISKSDYSATTSNLAMPLMSL